MCAGWSTRCPSPRVSLQLERLAWSVLRMANRKQAKGSTARIVVPRDPEMVGELGRERGVIPNDEDLLSAEEYLEEHGYLASTDIGLTRGTYTITPAGLRWIEEEPPRSTETPHTVGERADDAKPRRIPLSGEDRGDREPEKGVAGAQPGCAPGPRRPWWRRVLGG